MKGKKLKIALLANDDLLNGPSLAQFRFAKSLSDNNLNVDLIIANRSFKNDLSRFDNGKINFINLNKKRTIYLIWPLIKYLKKFKPDIIFSAGDHLNLILIISTLLCFSKCKLSLSSRVSPFDTYQNKSKSKFNSFFKSKIMYYLFKLISWRANVLTCVSNDMVKQYQLVFGKTKHVCVYNIIKDEDSKSLINEEISDNWIKNNKSPLIIAAGQLAPWKAFDDLLRAFVNLKKKIPHNLIILGDGPDRKKLVKIIEEENIQDRVYMPGYVLNTLKYFKISDIFVLSSLIEGMPNVLIEAMMCGCTPVSTNCKTGPEEIIKNNEFGYLSPVNNYELLAENILKAIERPISKDKLKTVVDNFNSEKIVKKHFELLKST